MRVWSGAFFEFGVPWALTGFMGMFARKCDQTGFQDDPPISHPLFVTCTKIDQQIVKEIVGGT